MLLVRLFVFSLSIRLQRGLWTVCSNLTLILLTKIVLNVMGAGQFTPCLYFALLIGQKAFFSYFELKLYKVFME